MSQTLYDRIKIEVERKVGETAGSLCNLDIADGESWLQALDTAWKAYTAKLVRIYYMEVWIETYHNSVSAARSVHLPPS